ncbi:hypothetical protein METBIDRAFT_29760 [Metschnikowia bicuspidata var. bicuspidata NRRL YB-4993]|uniref:Uncharacterized protein n=1 Tax=Metschnikowia bicuspidata var. bicuspidata NRRL YB-4993 TaxID=869754 RepID=A0A1A0HHC1_9ASCO|nr:hypothetical protein METBIDRAFT_29760 [Metschnikowia bicuspidata var. bicuspidata NRRL YB-4993]OBA23238.1 hypothetical protein METBIDRAFT_29760 [Metschnikowia bicuspidata var. bicuspidata NRRL YB-4993]
MFRLLPLVSLGYLRAARNIHSGARRLQNTQSANPFLYPSSVLDLAQKIGASLAARDSPVPKERVLDALRACKRLQDQVTEHDKLRRDPAQQQIQQQIDVVLLSDNVEFDAALLKQVFLLKFPQATTIKILLRFYERNPDAYIAKNDALIPFRDSLFNADLHSAIRITDMTTGHPNYIKHKSAVLRLGTLKLAASAIGITLFSKLGVQHVIDMGWLLPTWHHLASLNAMFLTYFLNSSFFVTVVKFGRQLNSAGGDFLTWQKGTFYTHWYRHADEMAMCTKIMEADVKLNGGPGNSAWLVEELCRKNDRLDEGANLKAGFTRDGQKIRLLEPRDSIEDLKLQAYWMSGGDGFEWVEPDQDPAELLWRQHLSKLHAPAVAGADTKNLGWAEDLIEEK